METKRKRNAKQNLEHQRAFQARSKAEAEMIEAVLDTGGVQFELMPVMDYPYGGPESNPLKEGVKIIFVVAPEAKIAMTEYAASQRNTTFEGMLEDMKKRLLEKLEASGFFKLHYRLKEEGE